MHTIPLNPYESFRNPVSVKLLVAAFVFFVIAVAPMLVIAVAPIFVAVLKDRLSVALLGTGLWLLVAGLISLYCVRMAMRIPGGFRELRLEHDCMVCVSGKDEITIPVSELGLISLDKIIANFVGFEIFLTHGLNVVQIAVASSRRDLEPAYATILEWLENDLSSGPPTLLADGPLAQ